MLSIPERVAVASAYRQIPDETRTDTLYTCVISELSERCKLKNIDPDDGFRIRGEAAHLSNEISYWLRDFLN